VSGASPALVARARGLGTHLLSRVSLVAARQAPDLESLAHRLEERGIPATPRPITAEALELSVRRWAARELARLARWLPAGDPLGDALFGEEDRRSLRAMLRGAAAGAPPARRLAGLIPTPTLPERLLAELARQPAPAAVAALLATWRHPLGPALRAATTGAEPDLAEMERALVHASLDALRARTRRHRLGAWTRDSIDIANARLAVGLAGRDDDPPLGRLLAEGGAVPLEAFRPVVSAGTTAEAARRAARLLPPGSFAAAFREGATRPERLDDLLLAARIGALAREAALDPLAPSAVLRYGMRLRAQVMLLREAIWRLALGMPIPQDDPLLEAAA
jgi:hypothetical protein